MAPLSRLNQRNLKKSLRPKKKNLLLKKPTGLLRQNLTPRTRPKPTGREAAEAVVAAAEAEAIKAIGEAAKAKKAREVVSEEEATEEEVEEEDGEEGIMASMLKDSKQLKLVVIETLEEEAVEEAEEIEAVGEEPTVKREEEVTDQEPAEEEVKDLQEEELVKKPMEISLELPLQPPNLTRLRNERCWQHCLLQHDTLKARDKDYKPSFWNFAVLKI